MHCRTKDNPDVAEVLTVLAACGYDGPLILEIEDLTFRPDLSLKEKTEIIAEDTAWIRTFFD
jgi:sugar phosphate isomerase/epimerase